MRVLDTGLNTNLNYGFSIKFGATSKSGFHGGIANNIDTFFTGLNPFHYSNPFTFAFNNSSTNGDTLGKWMKILGNVGDFVYNKNSNFVMELSFGYPYPQRPFVYSSSFGTTYQNMWGPADTFRSITSSFETLDLGFDIWPTGVAALRNITSFGLFPNPSTDGRFNISFDSKQAVKEATVKVSNVTGQSIYQQHYTDIGSSFFKEINLGNAPKGIYFMELLADGERVVRRVVLE